MLPHSGFESLLSIRGVPRKPLETIKPDSNRLTGSRIVGVAEVVDAYQVTARFEPALQSVARQAGAVHVEEVGNLGPHDEIARSRRPSRRELSNTNLHVVEVSDTRACSFHDDSDEVERNEFIAALGNALRECAA